MITKEEFALQHLKRMGNINPKPESIKTLIDLIDTDKWVGMLYQRANKMTAEIYNKIPTVEPEKE